MESFEVIVNAETYRIICNSPDNCTFSVFNYATCHIIKKNEAGTWQAIEHRFGTDNLPIKKIGAAIDSYHKLLVREEKVLQFIRPHPGPCQAFSLKPETTTKEEMNGSTQADG